MKISLRVPEWWRRWCLQPSFSLILQDLKWISFDQNLLFTVFTPSSSCSSSDLPNADATDRSSLILLPTLTASSTDPPSDTAEPFLLWRPGLFRWLPAGGDRGPPRSVSCPLEELEYEGDFSWSLWLGYSVVIVVSHETRSWWRLSRRQDEQTPGSGRRSGCFVQRETDDISERLLAINSPFPAWIISSFLVGRI